jgi:hypothetical protein
MREVDNVQEAKDNRKAQAEHCVERPVNQPKQKLSEQSMLGDTEQFEHHETPRELFLFFVAREAAQTLASELIGRSIIFNVLLSEAAARVQTPR